MTRCLTVTCSEVIRGWNWPMARPKPPMWKKPEGKLLILSSGVRLRLRYGVYLNLRIYGNYLHTHTNHVLLRDGLAGTTNPDKSSWVQVEYFNGLLFLCLFLFLLFSNSSKLWALSRTVRWSKRPWTALASPQCLIGLFENLIHGFSAGDKE